jgi:DNA polymerase I-like protein with 3'-5' exonuclease and polymerase domains
MAMTATERKAHKASMTVLSDWQEIIRVLDQEPGHIGLDLETTGLFFKSERIAVIALYGAETNTAGIIHLRGADPDPRLIDWLSERQRSFITHNGTAFDLLYLNEYGVKFRQPSWYDTLIGEQAVLTTDRKDVSVSLKKALERRLGVIIPKDVDHATWMLPELDAGQMRYLADDIYYLPRLRQSQLDRAAEQDTKYQKEGQPGVMDALAFEQELAPIVAQMMTRGLPIDVTELRAYTKNAVEAVPEHEAWLYSKLGTFKLGNHRMLKDRLNEVYDARLYDTTHDTLIEVAKGEGELAEAADRILRYRHGTKRGGMYDDDFIQRYIYQGRLYGNFVQLGTNTGRFSSRNPNMQQLNRDMRYLFRDPSGAERIVAADYSAIEVRCAADLYQDRALLKALESADIHRATASQVFGIPEAEVSKEQRRMAKAGNFNLLFGGGVNTLYMKARADGSEVSFDEMQRFYDRFLGTYKGVMLARARAYRKADEGRPLALTLPTGLRRVLVPGKDLKGTTILNTSVQSMAAAGLKHALFLLDQRGFSQYLSAVVHDEIVMSCPKELAADVAREVELCMLEGMAQITDAPVAVDAKGGEAWG